MTNPLPLCLADFNYDKPSSSLSYSDWQCLEDESSVANIFLSHSTKLNLLDRFLTHVHLEWVLS